VRGGNVGAMKGCRNDAAKGGSNAAVKAVSAR
jgi:hypothetical protein